MNSRLWLKRIVRRTACIAAPLAALLMTLMLSQPGNAQVLYGSIVGNVNDTQGAVVSSATVKITNKANNQSREAITNAEGGFNFPTVQAGRYDIVVTKSGFKTASTTIEVTLNSVARADIALEVGQVSETVSVTADTALLQTDRAEVRAELTSKALLNPGTVKAVLDQLAGDIVVDSGLDARALVELFVDVRLLSTQQRPETIKLPTAGAGVTDAGLSYLLPDQARVAALGRALNTDAMESWGR